MPIENVAGLENCVCHHPGLINLYGCDIGEKTRIGAFVEIGEGAVVGKNCKIETGAFIPPGTIIGNNVFIGPHATICNSKHPMTGQAFEPVVVEDDAVIGAGAVILPGVRIGYRAVVGAGAVVTKGVLPMQTVYGNPAKCKP